MKMECNMKRFYTSPMLEIYEVEVEQGFGASGGAGSGGYNPWSITSAEAEASADAVSDSY